MGGKRICPACGVESGAAAALCYNCGTDLSLAASAAIAGAGVQKATGGGNRAITRYSDGYTVARTTVGFGMTIKMLSAAVVALGAIAGMVLGGSSSGGGAYLVVGLLGGLIVAIPIYILGVLVAAQGQILKATLDSAVQSSPFLSQDDMRQVMSL